VDYILHGVCLMVDLEVESHNINLRRKLKPVDLYSTLYMTLLSKALRYDVLLRYHRVYLPSKCLSLRWNNEPYPPLFSDHRVPLLFGRIHLPPVAVSGLTDLFAVRHFNNLVACLSDVYMW